MTSPFRAKIWQSKNVCRPGETFLFPSPRKTRNCGIFISEKRFQNTSERGFRKKQSCATYNFPRTPHHSSFQVPLSGFVFLSCIVSSLARFVFHFAHCGAEIRNEITLSVTFLRRHFTFELFRSAMQDFKPNGERRQVVRRPSFSHAKSRKKSLTFSVADWL